MNEVMVLVDIGSTFTKVTAIDVDQRSILSQSNAPTTPSDVSEGLQNALDGLNISKKSIEPSRVLACSSAAGGLRMIAIGLVEDLTAKAAKQAALGAGARVLKTFSFQLTEEDREELIQLQPDIILLAGGTDGGNTENILHNAKVLASLPTPVPVVIAGNRTVAQEASRCFPESFSVYVSANVMPQIGKLQVEPAREAIRKVFMEKIIYAKGLTKASRLIDGIFMPTPAAVLRAGQLLSEGTDLTKGWGDCLIVDVGGATTDVHSLGEGMPTKAGVVVRGLPEPYAKRTVEGDLGVRVSILSLTEAVGLRTLAQEIGWSEERVEKRVKDLNDQPEMLPKDSEEVLFDRVLGHQAVKLGVGRHVGRLSEIYTPSGLVWIQDGKDLSNVTKVIGTGGVLINSKDPLMMLEGARQEEQLMFELRPENPNFFLDGDYILASMGLLAAERPEVALTVLKNSLDRYELIGRDK